MINRPQQIALEKIPTENLTRIVFTHHGHSYSFYFHASVKEDEKRIAYLLADKYTHYLVPPMNTPEIKYYEAYIAYFDKRSHRLGIITPPSTEILCNFDISAISAENAEITTSSLSVGEFIRDHHNFMQESYISLLEASINTEVNLTTQKLAQIRDEKLSRFYSGSESITTPPLYPPQLNLVTQDNVDFGMLIADLSSGKPDISAKANQLECLKKTLAECLTQIEEIKSDHWIEQAKNSLQEILDSSTLYSSEGKVKWAFITDKSKINSASDFCNNYLRYKKLANQITYIKELILYAVQSAAINRFKNIIETRHGIDKALTVFNSAFKPVAYFDEETVSFKLTYNLKNDLDEAKSLFDVARLLRKVLIDCRKPSYAETALEHELRLIEEETGLRFNYINSDNIEIGFIHATEFKQISSFKQEAQLALEATLDQLTNSVKNAIDQANDTLALVQEAPEFAKLNEENHGLEKLLTQDASLVIEKNLKEQGRDILDDYTKLCGTRGTPPSQVIKKLKKQIKQIHAADEGLEKITALDNLQNVKKKNEFLIIKKNIVENATALLEAAKKELHELQMALKDKEDKQKNMEKIKREGFDILQPQIKCLLEMFGPFREQQTAVNAYCNEATRKKMSEYVQILDRLNRQTNADNYADHLAISTASCELESFKINLSNLQKEIKASLEKSREQTEKEAKEEQDEIKNRLEKSRKQAEKEAKTQEDKNTSSRLFKDLKIKGLKRKEVSPTVSTKDMPTRKHPKINIKNATLTANQEAGLLKTNGIYQEQGVEFSLNINQEATDEFRNLKTSQSAEEKVNATIIQSASFKSRHRGKIIGSISGMLTGTCIGAVIGSVIGFVLAPVTFGASIPIGAAVGALCGGLCVGVIGGGFFGFGIGFFTDNYLAKEANPPSVQTSMVSSTKGISQSISNSNATPLEEDVEEVQKAKEVNEVVVAVEVKEDEEDNDVQMTDREDTTESLVPTEDDFIPKEKNSTTSSFSPEESLEDKRKARAKLSSIKMFPDEYTKRVIGFNIPQNDTPQSDDSDWSPNANRRRNG